MDVGLKYYRVWMGWCVRHTAPRPPSYSLQRWRGQASDNELGECRELKRSHLMRR